MHQILRGLSEYVIDNKTGLLYKYNNINQLREKMYKLINNIEFTKILGENAKKFAQQEFSKDKYYEEIYNIYQKLTRGEK